jgi:hypothetical protein
MSVCVVLPGLIQEVKTIDQLPSDEKFHNIAHLAMEDPSIPRAIDAHGNPTKELAFSFYILWICSHAHAMRQRRVLDDNEWSGVTMDEELFSKKNNKRNMKTNRA